MAVGSTSGPGRGAAEPLRADSAERAGAALPALPRTPGGWATILADPPWRFTNRTGKVAPEHRRLDRYDTMTHDGICALPVAEVAAPNSHLYLWVPNALLPEGLRVMEAWGYRYVSNLVWAKRRKDGGPDGRGVGFYFRNVTELILFGVRGTMRTLPPGRRQVNMIEARKREHSRKPDETYDIIEACSPAPYLELFARYPRMGWSAWGDEAAAEVIPRGRQFPAYGRRMGLLASAEAGEARFNDDQGAASPPGQAPTGPRALRRRSRVAAPLQQRQEHQGHLRRDRLQHREGEAAT